MKTIGGISNKLKLRYIVKFDIYEIYEVPLINYILHFVNSIISKSIVNILLKKERNKLKMNTNLS